jgi:hypothetical protein
MADETEKESTETIELAPGDGAFIISADGTPRLIMPHITDENENLAEHHVLLAAFALGYGLQDQRLLDLLGQIMEEKRLAVEARKAQKA